nr:hypothetical protein [Tanacetum cinerariifolium]
IFIRVKMSRDMITVGLKIRISLLYRGEYSQWHERFMNYIEEQMDGENAIPTLKDPKFWTVEEKKTRKIDLLAISLLIQGLPNDTYSLIYSNETSKDLWDALERQMCGSVYGKQDMKVVILYEYESFKAIEAEQLLDTYLRYLQVINDLKKCGYKKYNCDLNYKFLNNLQSEWKQYGTLMRQTKHLMDINIDALYNILKQNQGDVNDALGYKKKAIVVTSDPLALVVEKTKELALMCIRMFPEESDKIERYIGGLPDMIHGSVVASKPNTMQEAIEMETELMDKKIYTFAERQTENKRKQDDNNQAQQQPLKKQGVAIAYTTGPGEKKESPATTNNHRNPTCNQCGNQGHYRSDFPELKNQDHGNQARGTRAHGMVHALEGGQTNQDLNDNDDHPLPVVAQVSLAGTTQNAIPTLKNPTFWTVEEKKNRKIDHLWDALERQMCGSVYGEQDRKVVILYEYETFKATEAEQLLDTYLRYLQVINDLKKCGYKKDNYELNYKFLTNLQSEWKHYGDVNDALGYKKKAIVVTSYPLALVVEKTKVSKPKEKVEVQSETEESDVNDALGYKKKAFVVTSYPLALVVEKTKVSKPKEKVEVQSETEENGEEEMLNKSPTGHPRLANVGTFQLSSTSNMRDQAILEEDYHEIIEAPMDFVTMRAKLHEGLYTFLEQFKVSIHGIGVSVAEVVKVAGKVLATEDNGHAKNLRVKNQFKGYDPDLGYNGSDDFREGHPLFEFY